MLIGPNAEKRPAGVIANAVHVMRIATAEAVWVPVVGLAFYAVPSVAQVVDEDERARRHYELERAAAHADMPSTMHASTPSAAMPPHAVARGTRAGWSGSDGLPWNAEAGGETATDVFREHVSPIVQDQCVNCHVEGGPSGHTRLVFVRSSDPDHMALNQQVFEDFLDGVEDGADVVLNKIRGVGHGGGIQVPAGGSDYGHIERFLALLGGESTAVALTPRTLFEGVAMASARQTLRRAALIFAGRVPSEKEYASLGAVDMREAIRSLMAGPAFHDFLIRSSNDRLLTDRETTVLSNASRAPLVSYVNEWVHRCQTARANSDFFFNPGVDQWIRRAQYGARRAPLELIAHVVEHDLPYTEILTADYVMANPWSARAYGSSVAFDDPEDVHEFQPVRFGRYYLFDDTRAFLADRVACGPYILDPGELEVAFPHAGILNTMAFLRRYPTTATNRNRARARWTYYHFLGVDIEKSASRTTDPEALADTDNPTLKNPACTACHIAMDPVAGAYQNYDDIGHYRSSVGGMDSLDSFYRENPVGGEEFVIEPRFFDDRERVSLEGEFNAGTNTIGLMAMGFQAIGLDELLVRDATGALVERYRLGDAVESSTCGYVTYDGHPAIATGCLLTIDVDVPRAGRYRVEADVWDAASWNDVPAMLKIWAPGILYRQGDTWYRDMRVPGFGGTSAPDADNSVQWLAREIASDDRFAEAAVEFWWPAIMGEDVAAPPEQAGDADFEGQLLRANAQALEVQRLAQAFRRGIRGGLPYNLKDLLVEIVLSKWFRAEKSSSDDPIRAVALRGVGGGRLLTGEELAAKTLAVAGVQWGRLKPASTFAGRRAEAFTTERHALSTEYAILYGGIDSDGVTERARDLTAVMLGVAKRHAVQVSCPVVLREFYLLPDDERLLFAGINPSVSPADPAGARAIRAKLAELYDKLLGVSAGASSPEISRAYAFFEDVWTRKRVLAAPGQERFLDGLDDSACELATDEYYFENVPRNALVDSDLADPEHAARTWVVMLAALLMDHRYLHL